MNDTNSSNARFSSNIITASQWSTLEQYGAVFLSAAGNRSGTWVGNVSDYGYYWSASYLDNVDAYYVFFSDSNLRPQNSYFYRCIGLSVRLVRSVQ